MKWADKIKKCTNGKNKLMPCIIYLKKYYFLLMLILMCFTAQNAYTQTATASSKQKEYVIGDWIPVDLFVSAPTNNKVVFPSLKDSISETIEIANFTPIDTVKKAGQNEYHQLVNMIVFDTGQIHLPQFQFAINNNGKIDTITTDPILVHVAGVKIDTTKDIKDIKVPLKIPYTFQEILPYILGILILLLLIVLVVWFLKNRKKKQPPVDERFTLPPHVWALKELDKLQKEKLWQTGEVKTYYSRLTDIARSYIELRYRIPAMEKTTEELMYSMHKGLMKQSLKKELNDVLILSDFVKFAKAQPDFIENENAMKVVHDFIESTKQIEENKTVTKKEMPN